MFPERPYGDFHRYTVWLKSLSEIKAMGAIVRDENCGPPKIQIYHTSSSGGGLGIPAAFVSKYFGTETDLAVKYIRQPTHYGAGKPRYIFMRFLNRDDPLWNPRHDEISLYAEWFINPIDKIHLPEELFEL